jgi:lambda repressor-like predicted transcriptional regulator
MSRTIDFDAEIVREKIKEKGLSLSCVSVALGRNESYLRDRCRVGTINLEFAERLEVLLKTKIRLDDEDKNHKKISGQSDRADVSIDREKLCDALERRGLKKAEASRKIGKSNSFLNQSLTRGRTSGKTVEAIEFVLGIPPKEYVIGAQDEDDDRNQVNMFAPNDTLQEISDQITYLSRMIITLSTRVQGLEEALHIDRNGEV